VDGIIWMGDAVADLYLRPILHEDVAAVLDLICTPEMLRQGNVQIIGLQPIAYRLGDRWPRRRAAVWEHFERILRRDLPPCDVVLRIDDLHFVVAQTQEEGLAAQAICLRLAADLMTFFLGEAKPSDIRVNVVTEMAGGSLTCEPVDLVRVAAAGRRVETPPTTTPRPAAPVRKMRSYPLTTSLGMELKVDIALDGMWALQPEPRRIAHYARIALIDAQSGRRLSRADREQLQPGDLQAADALALTESMKMRAESPRSAGGLLIPISYKTVSNTNARNRLLHIMRDMLPVDRESFAWEIVDLDDGVPAGRLAEIVSLIRGHCRGVVCRIAPTREPERQFSQVGATASVAPSKPHAVFDRAGLERLKPRLRGLRAVMAAVLLHDLPSGLASDAQSAGATHCVFPVHSNDGSE
jgi:hypothetical protein